MIVIKIKYTILALIRLPLFTLLSSKNLFCISVPFLYNIHKVGNAKIKNIIFQNLKLKINFFFLNNCFQVLKKIKKKFGTFKIPT